MYMGIHAGMPIAQACIEPPGKVELHSFEMIPAVQPAIDVRIPCILEYLGLSRHFRDFQRLEQMLVFSSRHFKLTSIEKNRI
jgi:hypothetical protein